MYLLPQSQKDSSRLLVSLVVGRTTPVHNADRISNVPSGPESATLPRWNYSICSPVELYKSFIRYRTGIDFVRIRTF
jgi:hypothetical protein